MFDNFCRDMKAPHWRVVIFSYLHVQLIKHYWCRLVLQYNPDFISRPKKRFCLNRCTATSASWEKWRPLHGTDSSFKLTFHIDQTILESVLAWPLYRHFSLSKSPHFFLLCAVIKPYLHFACCFFPLRKKKSEKKSKSVLRFRSLMNYT